MQFALLCILLPLVAGHRYPLCNCGLGSGEDVCGQKKCTPLVVRPMEVPKPVLPVPKVVCAPVNSIPPLLPVGGPCSCHTALVKPAVLPKPACTACCGRVDVTKDHHMTLSEKQRIFFGGNCNDGMVTPTCGDSVLMTQTGANPILVDDVVPGRYNNNPANYVPADPVSVALAYKMATENCYQDEDKISFGFRTLPKDIPLYRMKKIRNIPEEDLYNLNGQIVELKKIKCDRGKTIDEEAAEELMAMAEEEEEEKYTARDLLKQVTLGEVGYAPANIKAPTFVDIPPSIPPVDLLDGLKQCDDGFKPGNVLITQVPKIGPMALPTPLPEPCGCDDDDLRIPNAPTIPDKAVFTSPYTYVSSSSSSSGYKNRYSQSVILQKLGSCNN